jgi:hypothetical protein
MDRKHAVVPYTIILFVRVIAGYIGNEIPSEKILLLLLVLVLLLPTITNGVVPFFCHDMEGLPHHGVKYIFVKYCCGVVA